MTVAATFEIRFTRYLQPDGREAADLPSFAADPRALVPDYRAMVFMRALDAKAVAMQRTGQIGTYASTLGKEAIDAGIGGVLRKEDVLLPSYRESGVLMLRGVSPHRTLLYWGGDERGNVFPESPRDFPFNVPIGTQMPHAAGVAYAMKLRREPRVALAMCGDGATSKGDFYESLNAAGVWQLPMVVVAVNNQYAISVPRHMQSKAKTLAQKAIGRRRKSRRWRKKPRRTCRRWCRPTSRRRRRDPSRCSSTSTPGCRGNTRCSLRNSPRRRSAMSNITLVEAINLALARAMEE